MWQQATDPDDPVAGGVVEVRGFGLSFVEGDRAGEAFRARGDRCAIGSHPSNDCVIDDRRVSRFHCEIALEPTGARLRDLGSKNGTVVDGLRVNDVFLREGSVVRLGGTALRFHFNEERNQLSLSEETQFGTLLGSSVAMRLVFSVLERASAADETVLLEGETGTGKEEAALSLHEASGRSDGPFVVVDCGSLPETLIESELFGHERGAFTGADNRRVGAFEAASSGTVFLDEIGELPLELQPKLLRVLESHAIRRVGSNEEIPVDVRVVAATNRTLRTEVNEGRFRSDLYYRLAVIALRLPPLRERTEDVALLAEHLLARMGIADVAISELLTKRFVARLESSAWPGNVRELRNYLARCIALNEPAPFEAHAAPAAENLGLCADPDVGYADARQQTLDAFERTYLRALLERHEGNVSAAARAADVHRVYLHRLLRRHGLRT